MVETSSRWGTEGSFAERKGWSLRKLIPSSKPSKDKEPSPDIKNSSHLPRRSLSMNGHSKERVSHRSINGEQDSPTLAAAQQTIKPVSYTPPIQTEKPNSYKTHETDSTNRNGTAGSLEEEKVLKRRFTDPEELIRSLKKTNEELKEQLAKQSAQIQQLIQDKNTLSRQCSEGADRSYINPQAHRPLCKPNSEVIKEWNNLGYDVENFVENHFRDISTKRIVSWATIQREYLRVIAEAPQDTVTNHNSGLALIKAAVWAELKRSAFGGLDVEGSLCWAGHYKTDIRRIDSKLKADFSQNGLSPLSAPHHQWRTLMANTISNFETPQQRSHEVEHVAINIEELLAPCRPLSSSSNAYHRELRGLVHKTIDMDLVLSGQTDAYTLHWVKGETFNHAYMTLAAGSPQGSGKTVRFMTRPGLYRADGRGEICNEFEPIEKCTVWM
ncbi:hypothetical protein LB507_010918 [Fusarium sp. FIESC RH6]|nr:hypothetical protein LB507_010918 [Fusarium sp. FIESC RH6]